MPQQAIISLSFGVSQADVHSTSFRIHADDFINYAIIPPT